MPFDAGAYKKDVLGPWSSDQGLAALLQSALSGLQVDPADNGYLTLDLPRLFALPSGQLTGAALEAHAVELDKAFNKARVYPAAAQLKQLKALLTATGQFVDPGFWAGFAAQRSRVLDQTLDQAVAALRSEAPLGVMPLSAAAARLDAFGVGGVVSDPSWLHALQRAGLVVFPDIDLPGASEFESLLGIWDRTLERARCRSIFDLIAYGAPGHVMNAEFLNALRIGGTPVRLGDLEAARQRSLAVRDSDEAQAIQKFLGQLVKIDDIETLRRLVILTLCRRVGEQVSRRVPLVAIVAGLTRDGIDDGDARRLVASLADRSIPAPPSLGPDAVRLRLARGELTAARRILAALPEDPDTAQDRNDLAAQITERSDRRDAAVVACRRALAERRFDAAAQHLRVAREIDRDDEGLERLAQQLPPPVPHATAQMGIDGVRIDWNPVDPDATYTVLRTTSVDGQGRPAQWTEIAKGLRTHRLEDHDVPSGVVVHYGVCATGPGGAVSDAGWCRVDVFPSPSELRVHAQETSVDLAWVVSEGARETRIDVVDQSGRRSQHRTAMSSWRLTGLTPGQTQHVVLRAVYLTDDGPRESTAVSIDVTPRASARPVDDLSIEPAAHGDGHVAHWSSPGGFTAEVWVFPRGARLESGVFLRPQDARASGGRPLPVHVIRATPETTDAAIEIPAEACQVVAMLVTDRGLLSGRPVQCATASPVSNACAEEFADQLRLTWEWPDGDVLAEVEWQTPSGSRTRRVTPARYRSEGGVYLPERHAIGDISIQTIARADGEEYVSRRVVLPRPPMTETVVAYTADLSRSLAGRVKVALSLTCERPATLDFGLYLRQGATMPLTPEAAARVHHLTADFTQAPSFSTTIDLGRVRGPFWIRVFADDRQNVRVVDPPTPQLRG